MRAEEASTCWRMIPFKKRKMGASEQVMSEGQLDDSNDEEEQADASPASAWHRSPRMTRRDGRPLHRTTPSFHVAELRGVHVSGARDSKAFSFLE